MFLAKNIANHLSRLIFLSLIITSLFINTSIAVQLHNTNDLKGSKPLRIAVAANFAPILKILLVDFHQQSQIKTQMISGASGAMYLQIKHGAPFDIFLSADSKRPKQLEQDKLIVAGSRQTYAFGQLALLSNNGQETLTNLQQIPKRFAIANPDIAPYGKAAKETLEHLKLWPKYANILIKGININQTFAQVRSKAVNSGLVANSQLVLNNLSGVVIPADYHQPITQQLVIIKKSTKQQQAKQLSTFLLSNKVQAIISQYGYQVDNSAGAADAKS